MKFAMSVILAGILSLVLASGAGAESATKGYGTPTSTTTAAAPASATSTDTPTPSTDPGASGGTVTGTTTGSGPMGFGSAAPATPPAATPPVTPTAQDRLIKAIQAQVTLAENFMKQFTDEMAKPEKKRNPAAAMTFKLRSAQSYLQAAQVAHNGGLQLKKDEQQAFFDQYDKPNREKAINLFLELAGIAHEAKDYPDAVALYRTVLGADPKNEAAAAALKLIDAELKAAAASQPGQPTGTGGSNQVNGTTKPYQTWKGDYTGYSTWHGWGGYGY
jgi:hypothetical protein